MLADAAAAFPGLRLCRVLHPFDGVAYPVWCLRLELATDRRRQLTDDRTVQEAFSENTDLQVVRRRRSLPFPTTTFRGLRQCLSLRRCSCGWASSSC